MPPQTSQQSIPSVCMVFCTCPDGPSAQRIANALVSEGLAACVNQVAGIQSTYRWQGELTQDQEVLLLIKTATSQIVELEKHILELHPYELPEVLAVPSCGGSRAYLEWVQTTVSPST